MKKTGRILLAALLLTILVVSAVQLLRSFSRYLGDRASYQQLQQTYVQPAPEEPEAEACPVSIDFDALQSAYPDVIGWLYCADTPVHYPVCRGADNDTYLRRAPDGTDSQAGSLFADVRCGLPDLSKAFVIYGHHMADGSMFGSLSKYQNPDYLREHPEFWFLTPAAQYRAAVRAAFVMDAEAEPFLDGEADSFRTYFNAHRDEAVFCSGMEFGDDERLLILSTCSYESDNARFVLVGTLAP